MGLLLGLYQLFSGFPLISSYLFWSLQVLLLELRKNKKFKKGREYSFRCLWVFLGMKMSFLKRLGFGIIDGKISPHHNFCQIDLQGLIFLKIHCAGGRRLQGEVWLEGLFVDFQDLLGNLAFHEINNRLNVVVETILEFLVMASALVGRSFPEGL